MDISCSALINSFHITPGDAVLVSSDLTMLMWMSRKEFDPITPKSVIEGLQQILGGEGTLLLPTFNWEFCKGKGFDYIATSCKTGALGVEALKRNDFKRTRHPIYSFAVWGKDAGLLYGMHNISSFGADSPFAYLHHRNAANILIDVDYKNCFTFAHYAEEQTGLSIPYRYEKTFYGNYTDENGVTSQRGYTMLVRSYELETKNTINPLGEMMEKAGVARRYDYFGRMIRILKLGEAYSYLEDDIIHNRSRNICTFIGQDENHP